MGDHQKFFEVAPGGVAVTDLDTEVGRDAGRLARVTTQAQNDFRRPAESHLAGHSHDLPQLSLPHSRRPAGGSLKLPVADGGSVGERAREIDSGAQAKRLKMVELPPVVGQQM